MKKNSSMAGFLLLVSIVAALLGCQKTETPYDSSDRIEEILKISENEERRNELLLYHLENPSNNAAAVYLGREMLLQGRTGEAKIYLEAPRDGAMDGRAERLALYLRGYLSYLEQDYLQAEQFLGRFDTVDSPPEEKEAGNLDARADLLRAGIMIGLGENPDAAADILLDLWRRDRGLLDERRLLELADLLRQLGRSEEARILISDVGSTIPYNPLTSLRWARIAEVGGMEFLKELGRVEDILIRNKPSAGILSDSTLHDGLLPAIESEQWQEAEEIVHVLQQDHSHRFLPFLDALCRLRAPGAGTEELELFQRTGNLYRETQFYYYHLWKGLDDMGDLYRPLMKEALTASILVNPSSPRAEEARRRLALLYGLEGEGGPAPLTEIEMKRLTEFVLQGAPVEVLKPMLEFLEWPENPCTLQAGLLLREVKNVPGVRRMMEEFLSGSGERARERFESILTF